jgi:hypothetical protein
MPPGTITLTPRRRVSPGCAGHLDLVAMVGGHRGAGTQGETSASRDTHVDLALQHHADGEPGALLRGRHIGEPVMHVGGDQAHATAHELFVDFAAAGPLVVAQVFRISAVIEAMALAEAAVIGKGEVSGHRSARTGGRRWRHGPCAAA